MRVNDLFRDDDTALLFLPLAHNFARLVQFTAAGRWLPARVSAPTSAASRPRCGGRSRRSSRACLACTRRSTPPCRAAAAESGGVKRRLAEWAFAVGERKASGGGGAAARRCSARIADKLVLGKVRARMGGRMRFAVSGGAPLAPEIARFFEACGVTDPRGLRDDRVHDSGDDEPARGGPASAPSARRFPGSS